MDGIIRVFPRKTNMTPFDDYSYYDEPGMFLPPHNEVHISCTFTWDKPRAEQLYEAWYGKAPVKLGGPAYDDPGETFMAGMYVKPGIAFSSRGCPNSCKFCHVPRREGNIKELPIVPDNIIQDNNFLACNRAHREKVYQMLKQQSNIEMRGGLEVSRLTDWDIEQMRSVRINALWIACDTKGSVKKVVKAITRLLNAGFNQNHIRCYVLIGDDMVENEERLKTVYRAGALPFAQLYQPEVKINYSKEWKDLSRIWSRPAIYKAVMNKEL
jgi:hypothetical protein